ncbi:hypothetical protein HFN20_13940 [Paenibacillus dendritiformis]|uniref:hypothetical protein n=1 Tax=Paenibacillus dendritiformis TaxID=130049 RepID=UPI00143D0658|nr:hypothetical protein [Paenibacillus dendritiformis]NKI22305.1 hypothetical protein [Paenibacillus dendritiformis]NRF99529.1 hypothetical protein [Paenibacillus dendritiformis]
MESVNYRTFSREEFDAGVWGQMRRVALAGNGQVLGIHDKDNTNKWEDGTDVNWADYTNNGWNCMVQIPKFYYKARRGEHNGLDKYRLEISNKPQDGFKVHPAFEREEGVIENYQYMSAFEGWIDPQGRLRSLPGRTPTTNQVLSDSRKAAFLNGDHFTQQDFYLTSALQMLYLVEYGDFYAQKMLYGRVNSKSMDTTGSSRGYGNKSFGSAGFMSYRGVENFYGNIFKFIDGIDLRDGSLYASKMNVHDLDNYKFIGDVPSKGITGTSTTTGGKWTDIYFSENADFCFIPKYTSSFPSLTNTYYSSGKNSKVLCFGGHYTRSDS